MTEWALVALVAVAGGVTLLAPTVEPAPVTTTTTSTTVVAAAPTWTDPTTGVTVSAETWVPTTGHPPGAYWNDICVPAAGSAGAWGSTLVGAMLCTPTPEEIERFAP